MNQVALQQRSCHTKHRYFDEISAVIVANKRAARGAPPLRAYACPHCGGWHLTKQKPKVSAEDFAVYVDNHKQGA